MGAQGSFPWVSSDRGQGDGRTEMWDQHPAPQTPVLAPRPNTNLLCDSGQTPFLPWACVSGVHRVWVEKRENCPLCHQLLRMKSRRQAPCVYGFGPQQRGGATFDFPESKLP